MNPFKLQTRLYAPGRVKGPLRISAAAAYRDGIVVINWRELAGFDSPCSALAVIEAKPFSHLMTRLPGDTIPTIIVTAEQAARLPVDEVNQLLAV